MREDMAKMICECLRVGDKTKYRQHRRKSKHISEDGENQPRHESMRKWAVVNWGGKEFGENLAPLYRYLDKQVNRPWDNVFSEICEHIKMDSTVQRHIREHVEMHVNLHVTVEGGKIYSKGYSWGGSLGYPLRVRELYVCPKSGILKAVKKGQGTDYRFKPRPKVKIVWTDNNHQLHQINNIWYEVELDKIENWNNKKMMALYDAITGFGESDHRKLKEVYGIDGFYGSSKRQLSSKELRSRGLENKAAA
jgi:hypothetical protein